MYLVYQVHDAYPRYAIYMLVYPRFGKVGIRVEIFVFIFFCRMFPTCQ